MKKLTATQKKMVGYIRHTLFTMLLLLLAAGCTDKLEVEQARPQNPDEELPVEFTFGWSGRAGTRGFDEGDNVKTAFRSGDVIHIQGTFNTKYLLDDGETYGKGVITRYGAFTYNGKGWTKTDGSTLTWPSIAVDGQFKAYYVSNSNGVLTSDKPTVITSLSEITPSSDPLKAESDPGIEYGHAVQLDFSHICAYLTLIDLEPMVADEYWLHRPLTDNGTDEQTFNNAFSISLAQGAHGQELKFEFFQLKNSDYNNMVSIAARAIESRTYDESGTETVITKANYFLEPGYYDTFSLCYPSLAPKTFDYLKYDYNNIPDNVGGVDTPNTPPDLKGNTTYTLTITKSPGITIVNPPSPDGWDDSGVYKDVDVEEFLKAVNNNGSYTNSDGEQILESTPNGTRLLYNVDFKFQDYTTGFEDGFYPNIMAGSVFDGNHHYIKNLASPLFRYNFGTIQNLGIRDVRIDATSYEAPYEDENEDENKDQSRHGALCMWNRAAAVISNVRVMSVDMTIRVQSEIQANDDGSETHNIGGVVGSNTGRIHKAALSGNFNITVTGTDKNVNASVLIGGLAGQNAASGEIYDVSPLEDDLSIRITNSCEGDIGSYSVGGIVGESTGFVTGVILSNITVDGSLSKGVTSYMGGIAGKLEVSSGSEASVKSCIVNGSVTAGTTMPYGDIHSSSYIGGLVGSDLGVPVIGSRGAVSTYGSSDAREDVLYATGGAFGRIRETASGIYDFQNLIAYGSELKAPQEGSGQTVTTNYTGNFAGIVPKGHDWPYYAAQHITVRVFSQFENIGKALDSNNNE